MAPKKVFGVRKGGEKVKPKTLSVNKKLKGIEKLENGATHSEICAEYGNSNQSVSDIQKSKDKLHKYAMKFNVDQEKSGIKRMRKVGNDDLEEAVYKWPSADVSNVEPFRKKLKDLMEAENFRLCQQMKLDFSGNLHQKIRKPPEEKIVCLVGNFQKSECLRCCVQLLMGAIYSTYTCGSRKEQEAHAIKDIMHWLPVH
ncbi:Tigger transposable element-derived protein 4-like 4 [Homarus americanus]|uniref:Tigger transposable element-derived protein 4-like 4 n=1 Tax=Homarus americanus TaxID=6706 RepID=A0A8J5JK57_HOMAM|nr:Tigger transposable element-derived protein 4-like 4 [Homarus americanus]